MLIFKAIQDKIALFLGIIVSVLVFVWPAIPLRGLDVWLKTLISLFPTNVGYPILSLLIGIYITIFIYLRRDKKICLSCQPSKSGAFGGIVGLLFGVCPACIPTIAFFLPLSLTITLGSFSWLFLLAAIIFLIFAIWRIGGFKLENSYGGNLKR